MTIHHIEITLLRVISYKRLARFVDYIVVHTKFMKAQLEEIGITNVTHIEYPKFNVLPQIFDAKQKLEIFNDNKVIACIGGTREDKGLDLLLKALDRVKQSFHLLIAGKEEAFSETFIQKQTYKYKENITCIFKYLTDEELNICINAADIICLPYRKIFNGASGPLTKVCGLEKQS